MLWMIAKKKHNLSRHRSKIQPTVERETRFFQLRCIQHLYTLCSHTTCSSSDRSCLMVKSVSSVSSCLYVLVHFISSVSSTNLGFAGYHFDPKRSNWIRDTNARVSPPSAGGYVLRGIAPESLREVLCSDRSLTAIINSQHSNLSTSRCVKSCTRK